MVSIILSASEEVKKAAKEKGFVERTVLVKHDAIESTKENKSRLESQLFELKPFQFLVSDYWGMRPD